MQVKRSLIDYVKVYPLVDKKICNEIIAKLKNDWQKHTFYSHVNKDKYNFDNDLSISHQTTSFDEYIHEQVYNALKKYVKEDIALPSLPGWDGFTNVRFNKYDKNTEMHWHADRVQQMFDGERKGIPTLSVVGLLNDNFQGGDFIMFDNEKINLVQGDILIFPSTFMYPHKVTAIKEGVRYSFVSWMW